MARHGRAGKTTCAANIARYIDVCPPGASHSYHTSRSKRHSIRQPSIFPGDPSPMSTTPLGQSWITWKLGMREVVCTTK